MIGAVLAQMTVSMGGHAIPTESGFRVALLIGCGVAVLGAAISTTIPTRRTPDFSEPTITAEPVAVRA